MTPKKVHIPSEDEIEQSLLRAFRIILVSGAFAFAVIVFFVSLNKAPGSTGNIIIVSMVTAFVASSLGILLLSVFMRFWRFWRFYVVYTAVAIGLIMGGLICFSSSHRGALDLFLIIWPGIKPYFVLTAIFSPILSSATAYSSYANQRKEQP